jgi:hypothetical protein
MLLAIVFLSLDRCEENRNKSLPQLVTELGPPSFLAKTTEIVTRRVKTLGIQVPPQDPHSVSNWSAIADTTVVWANTEVCRRNARYFYDEMKNDPSFDGGAWYSSRSPFGEKLTIANIDNAGRVTSCKVVRVDAVAISLLGFVPRNTPDKLRE